MKKVIEFFRIKEWYSSKIPLAMTIYLYELCTQQIFPSAYDFLMSYGGYFIFFFCYFAFNYLINDYADFEADKIAGKIKVIHTVRKNTVLLCLILTFLIGCLTLWSIYAMKFSLILMSLAVYFLGASYSTGLRLKEKGIWGVIVSSFAQRNSPILILMLLIPMNWKDIVCWMILVFINGLRYILIHQHIDKENDRKSGIHTFVSDHNYSIKGAIIFSLIIETIVLFILMRSYIKTIFFWIFLFVYLAICILNFLFVNKVAKSSYFFSYVNVPYEDLYNVFLPFIFTFLYSQKSHLYGLLIVTICYLIVPFCKKMGMPVMSLWKLITHDW